MKSPFFRYGILALRLPLGLAVLAGCQESTGPASYQEYSDHKNIKDQDEAAAKNSPAAKGAEVPAPAIAEKPNEPAIAPAGDNQQATGKTEPVSVARQENNGQSRPGQLALAPSDGPPRRIKLLVPEKNFSKASADGTLRVSYDDIDLLKVLNANPVPLDITDYFPEWLDELDGKRVRIRGFMYPAFQETGLEGFVLARDNAICCFGRDPKVYDLIRVVMKEGTTTDYLPNRPFDVVGTFHIVPEADGETLFRLYEIRDAQVITGR